MNATRNKDKWDSLSMKEKSDMMKVAVQQGIYNLSEIRKAYNEYAEGGPIDESNNIVDWIINEEGFNSKPENIGDGKITLGSGLTSSKWHKIYNKKGTWTAEDNRAAVAEEVENRRRWAEQNIPNWSELPADSQNALLSYKYNYNFTPKNSPKLFKALEDRNYEEAARQMDATSSNPRFKKGLQARRQREQEMFMRGIDSMNVPEPEVVKEVPQEESIYTPPQNVLDNIAVNNGRYMIMGNPPLAGVRNTVLNALRRLKALNLFEEGGPESNPFLKDYIVSSDNTYVNKIPITEDRIAADDILTKIAAEQARINSLPNPEPVRGLEIVSPEFDLITLGRGLSGGVKKAVKKINKHSSKKESNLTWDAEQMLKDGNNHAYTQEDIDILNSHIPEYKKIEKAAKANGTYLRMPDGSTWRGDPREWVIAQSNNVKANYIDEILTHGNSDSWIDKNGRDVTGDILGKKAIWTSTNPYLGGTYGNKRYRFVIPKNTDIKTMADAEGRFFREVKPGMDTDMIVYPNLTEDNVIRINNVVDRGPYQFFREEHPKPLHKETLKNYNERVFTGDDLVLGENIRRKALLGNNGEFDISSPNIFKGTIPVGIGSTLYNKSKK